MKLFSYWRSSSSWRVRIALAVKGIAYEYVAVHLVDQGGEQNTDLYRRLNPMAEVPCLVFDQAGETIALSQSLAIIAYLDERYPMPALLPDTPLLRARVRQFADMIGAGIQPLHNLRVQNAVAALGGDKRRWTAHFIHLGLTALEKAAAPVAGQCLVGHAVTVADLCLVPQMASARRFGVPVDDFPTLVRVEAHLAELAPFRAAHANVQPDAQP